MNDEQDNAASPQVTATPPSAVDDEGQEKKCPSAEEDPGAFDEADPPWYIRRTACQGTSFCTREIDLTLPNGERQASASRVAARLISKFEHLFTGQFVFEQEGAVYDPLVLHCLIEQAIAHGRKEPARAGAKATNEKRYGPTWRRIRKAWRVNLELKKPATKKAFAEQWSATLAADGIVLNPATIQRRLMVNVNRKPPPRNKNTPQD